VTGQYAIGGDTHTAEAAFTVRDDQEQGLGKELIFYLTYLAKRQGLLGFTAETLWITCPCFAFSKRALI
jgi:hypothetical protein